MITLNEYIERGKSAVFKELLERVALWGALVFVLMSGLDYISTPENFKPFLIYRLAMSAVLLFIAALARILSEEDVMFHKSLAMAGIAASAITVELMILKTGGAQSHYYVGHIIIGICALGLIPAGFYFHTAGAALIYAVYLFPILLTGAAAETAAFFTANFFIVTSLASTLYLRYLNGNSLNRELTLEYELLQSEDALLESERQIKNIINSVEERFIVIDNDFNIVSANRAYLMSARKTFSEAVDNKCYQVAHAKTRPCFEDGEECAAKYALQTGKPHIATYPRKDADGGERIIEFKAYPQKNQSGDITSVIVTTVDVTDRKKRDREAHRSDKLQSIGTLAGGIAHDFNNLLLAATSNIVQAKKSLGSARPTSKPRPPYLRAVNESTIETEAAKMYLEEALSTLSRAKALAVDLSNLSGSGKSYKNVVHPSAFIENAVGSALGGVSTKCEYTIAPDTKPVEVDEGQITQALYNIVMNSVEAMQEGGRLRITAENVSVESGHVLPLDSGDYVKISIEDTGLGIDKDNLSRIFEPYFSTKKIAGGLGLTMSYTAVKKHGGTIDVESLPGKGSTFTIYLPAAPQPYEKTA